MLKLYYSLIIISVIIFTTGCQPENIELNEELGYLKLNTNIEIEVSTNGRSGDVNTDDFRITVFNSDGTEHLVFDNYTEVPDEIALPVGEYYVEGHSDNFQNVAFEEPYYFGRSDNFTIHREEESNVTINASLANTQISVNWSDAVINNFDDYSAEVSLISTGESLVFDKDETRSGYFVTSPLAISATLSFTDPDNNNYIEKNFSSTISDPKAKTHYKINIDATVEDGQILIQLNVDDEVEVIEIDLGQDDIVYIDDETLSNVSYHQISFDKPTILIFRNLTTVEDAVYFHQCNNIKEIWFPALTTVGNSNSGNPYFYFHQNQGLETVGAPKLESVYGYFYMNGNTSLDISDKICNLKDVYTSGDEFSCSDAYVSLNGNASDETCFTATVHTCD